MKVIRKVEKNVKHFQIGDQIKVGRYTATAVQKAEDGMIFCLDQVYGERPVKQEKITNKLKSLINSQAFKAYKEFLVPFESDADGNEFYFRLPSITELYSDLKENPWEYIKKDKTSLYFYGQDIFGNARDYWSAGDITSLVTESEEEALFIRPVFKLREG